MLKKFLFGLSPLFVAFEADTGGGGGTTDPALDLTAENQPEPSGSTLEDRLTSSKTIIGQLFSIAKKHLGLETELKTAKHDNVKLQGQFKVASEGWENEKAEHGKTKASLNTVTGERDTEKQARATTEGHVDRLETLCGVKGIDPKTAVAAAAGPSTAAAQGEQLAEQWSKLKGRAKSAFYQAHKAELDAYSAAHTSKPA